MEAAVELMAVVCVNEGRRCCVVCERRWRLDVVGRSLRERLEEAMLKTFVLRLIEEVRDAETYSEEEL